MAFLNSALKTDVVIPCQYMEKKAHRGMVGGAFSVRRYFILLMQACTGQKAGLPERLSPIGSPPHTIFLIGEFKAYKGGCIKGVKWTCKMWKSLLTNAQVYILQTEGHGIQVSCHSIFSRAK